MFLCFPDISMFYQNIESTKRLVRKKKDPKNGLDTRFLVPRHKNCGGSWLIVVQSVTTLAVGRAEERCHVPDIEWQYAPGRWNMTKNSTLAVVRVQITVLENKVTSRVQESSAEIQSMEYRVQSTGG